MRKPIETRLWKDTRVQIVGYTHAGPGAVNGWQEVTPGAPSCFVLDMPLPVVESRARTLSRQLNFGMQPRGLICWWSPAPASPPCFSRNLFDAHNADIRRAAVGMERLHTKACPIQKVMRWV